MFGNPVAQAFIRPPGSPLIAGSFRVTAAFGAIDADHPTPHIGVDIGNARCGEPILAIEAGPVTLAGLLGSSKVVRIAHPASPGDESGYAHLATIEVSKDQLVTRGQRIGTLGMTGASACHLHLGMKRNGVEVDVWPLLDQNQEDTMLQGTNPRPIENRKVSTAGTGVRFRSSPFVKADNVLVQLAQGTELHPDYLVDGTAVGVAADKRWYAGWGKTPKGIEFGYVSFTVVTAAVPIEQTGHTDAELTAAAKSAAHAAAVSVAGAAASAAAKYPAA